MARFRITWFTQLQRHSFTESWYAESSQSNVNGMLAGAIQYAQARAKLLGAPNYIYAIRVSDVTQPISRSLLTYQTFLGNQEKDGDGKFLHGSAASNVALNCVFQSEDIAFEKTIQLRGIWDDVEVEGGAVDLTNPAFVTAFTEWAVKVRQLGYGWLAKTGQKVSPLASYSIKESGALEFTFAPNFFTQAEVDAGKSVAVRLRKQLSSPNLNGPITLKATALNKGETLKSTAAFPWTGGGSATRNEQSFKKADSGRIQRLGKRQAGAPLLQSRGRGPNRTVG